MFYLRLKIATANHAFVGVKIDYQISGHSRNSPTFETTGRRNGTTTLLIVADFSVRRSGMAC